MRADLDRRPMRVGAGGPDRDVAQQTHAVACTPGRLVQPRTGCVLQHNTSRRSVPQQAEEEFTATASVHITSTTRARGEETVRLC